LRNATARSCASKASLELEAASRFRYRKPIQRLLRPLPALAPIPSIVSMIFGFARNIPVILSPYP
jgi:hypothetical protein